MAEASLALVTGGNRGIGLGVCRQLAGRGYAVLLTGRDLGAARAAADRIEGAVTPLQLDVTDAGSVEAARAEVEERFGRLDVLVNNAAADYDTDQDVLSADLDRVRRALETNTLGPWRVAQAFVPLLRANGCGRLVNVSSGYGALSGVATGPPGYSLSKAALNALAIMLAAALADDGVLVNAVGPGWVRTDMGGAAAPRSVEEGAASVVWAATLPDNGPTGGFFRDGRRIAW
ncbi:MAG: SDR family NAD(P)-dependent oxidoreductase [Rhodothermaceae bacterium]|nr:SDR family NAD(P)-dependent oxidoreductase [Rhodothermaceae bacterium]